MYKICFVIPYYNHPKTIINLVEILKPFGLSIVIVNDGSNEESSLMLEQLNANVIVGDIELMPHSQVYILNRTQNGGKGAALKDGFKMAKKMGFSHIFQIDADMQHDLSKIQSFLDVSKKNQSFIVCAEPVYDENAPKSRLYGRKITDFWVYINTLGGDIRDSMCGMRIYPVDAVFDLLKACGNRMDFDIDILLYAFKNDTGFIWIKVGVKYETSVSHFKVFRDNMLISFTHAKHFFLLPSLIYKRVVYGRKMV